MNNARLFTNARLLMVLGAICMSIASFTSVAHASGYDCTAGCQSLQQWQGTTYGGKIKTQFDDPGFFTSNAYYMKWLRLDNANNAAHTDIGMVKNHSGSNSPYCNSSDTNLQDFVYIWNADLSLQDHYCADVPGNWKNTLQLIYGKPSFTCYSLAGENDGVIDEWEIQGLCFDVEQASYGRMNIYAKIQDAVTGHQVWGGQTVNSSWVDSNFNYHYQTVDPQVGIQNGAMRMYWNVLPSVGQFGGNLFSCVYQFLEIPECTLGS